MDTVKTLINANIKTNGNQEITGLVLNGVLNAMVDRGKIALNAKLDASKIVVVTEIPTSPDSDTFYFIEE